MVKAFVSLSFLLLAGCSVSAGQLQNPPPENAEARNSRSFGSAVPRGFVRFRYMNGYSASKCILAEDFGRHPARPLLRVVDAQTGATSKYTGPIEDRPTFFIETSFVIVRPGEVVEATLDVEENYDVSAGRSYRVSYSLPITDCRALLAQDVAVPTASDPFDPPSANPLPTWAERLEFVRNWYEDWAEVGEFVELEGTLTVPADE